MKNNRPGSSGNEGSVPENTHSKKRFIVWWILGSLASVLLAVGAYSKDSLFVRYFMHAKAFSAVRSVTMAGQADGPIFRAYSTKIGELIAPVQIMIYLNIRNESEEPQSVEGILIEFQGSDGRWIPAHILDVKGGVYTALDRSTHLKEARLLNLQGAVLTEELGRDSLRPHAVISGWLLLEFPEAYRTQDMKRAPLRLTISSGFGEKERHELRRVDLSPDATQTRRAFLRYSDVKRDISSLTILSERELWKKLAEQRTETPVSPGSSRGQPSN